MQMINDNLSAKDFLNYAYCPRIVYFMHVLKIPQETTKKEFKGREKYDEFKSKSKRTKIVKEFQNFKKIYNTRLESKEHGFLTLTDCIIFDDSKKEAYPIQAKYSFKPRKVYITQRYQLMFEGVLIEDTFKLKVPFGFIKFLKSNDLVKVDLSNKQEIFAIADEIRNIIKNEAIPEMTPYKKRCVDCCYKKICWGL